MHLLTPMLRGQLAEVGEIKFFLPVFLHISQDAIVSCKRLYKNKFLEDVMVVLEKKIWCRRRCTIFLMLEIVEHIHKEQQGDYDKRLVAAHSQLIQTYWWHLAMIQYLVKLMNMDDIHWIIGPWQCSFHKHWGFRSTTKKAAPRCKASESWFLKDYQLELFRQNPLLTRN